MSQTSLPLSGITVVSLEHAIAAPYCSRQLAELGARVIKIERRSSGDFARHYDSRVEGQSSHFIWTNRSKQSLTLDIKHPGARVVLQRLLEGADVLLQNLAPAAARRLGLSRAALAPTCPQLIVCNISGYGDSGPYQQRKAYDLLVQAEAGLLSVTGTADAMAKSGISIADIAAASQAVTAILAALIQRSASGSGSEIQISMLEALTEWMGYPLYYAWKGQPPPPRTGTDHASIYPYGAFHSADGEQFLLGLQNEREWQRLCVDILEQPGLATDSRFASNAQRSANREALQPLMQQCFGRQSLTSLGERLDQAQIAWARINDMAAVWQHPQLLAQGSFTCVDTPAGPVQALKPPARHSDFEPSPGPVPAIGEHTSTILAELGFTDAEITQLKADKIV